MSLKNVISRTADTWLGFRSKLCVSLPSTLIYSPCAGLVQVRGAKKKFGGIRIDPYKSLKKRLRMKNAQKTVKVPLMSSERRAGMMIYPISQTSSGTIFATSIPLERFAKAPVYTRAGMQQRWRAFKESFITIYTGALIRRKLRKVDPFKPIDLARQAQEMFIKANKAIQSKDKETLRTLTTEQASEGLKNEFQAKRFEWEMLEEVERPRIVSARAAPYDGKDLMAQFVLRMHTKQIMALYSSAGTVSRGHPTQPRTVIDYVVFERPLELPDRVPWRIAGKLPPQLPWKKELNKSTQTKPIPT